MLIFEKKKKKKVTVHIMNLQIIIMLIRVASSAYQDTDG